LNELQKEEENQGILSYKKIVDLCNREKKTLPQKIAMLGGSFICKARIRLKRDAIDKVTCKKDSILLKHRNLTLNHQSAT